MHHDLRLAPQRAHLIDPDDDPAVPLDAKLELLVRIEAVRVDREFGQGGSFRGGLRDSCRALEPDLTAIRSSIFAWARRRPTSGWIYMSPSL
jgi:hypothetical protein